MCLTAQTHIFRQCCLSLFLLQALWVWSIDFAFRLCYFFPLFEGCRRELQYGQPKLFQLLLWPWMREKGYRTAGKDKNQRVIPSHALWVYHVLVVVKTPLILNEMCGHLVYRTDRLKTTTAINGCIETDGILGCLFQNGQIDQEWQLRFCLIWIYKNRNGNFSTSCISSGCQRVWGSFISMCLFGFIFVCDVKS